MLKLLFTLCLCCSFLSLTGQDETGTPVQLGKWTVNPILGLQAWGTYTMGQREYDAPTGQYVDVDNRVNFMIRRLRFGSTAQIGDRLFFKFLGAGDFIGSDQRAGTVGGVNNGGLPALQVWDIYARYKITPTTEGLYVIGGYMRPAVGRENISGALGVSSFEKSFSQFYVRQHLVGTGPGGTGGVAFGGLASLAGIAQVDYRAGIYNPQNNTISSGRRSSSLFTGRINFAFGDPERATWDYGLAGANSFGKRKTVSIALNGAVEGATAASEKATLVGVDALVNFGHFHLEGEYHNLLREASAATAANNYTSSTFAVRGGYNFAVSPAGADRPRYLEATAMVYGFRGALDEAEYASALATNFFGGEETVIDLGLNYHLVPNHVRLGLHYVMFSGERGVIPPDGLLSQYWSQGGIGGIERGDYVGFELILSR